jgi:hypothetical protein
MVDLRKLVSLEKMVKSSIHLFLATLDTEIKEFEQTLMSREKFEFTEELMKILLSVAAIHLKQVHTVNKESVVDIIYDSLLSYAHKIQPGISKIRDFGGKQ